MIIYWWKKREGVLMIFLKKILVCYMLAWVFLPNHDFKIIKLGLLYQKNNFCPFELDSHYLMQISVSLQHPGICLLALHASRGYPCVCVCDAYFITYTMLSNIQGHGEIVTLLIGGLLPISVTLKN